MVVTRLGSGSKMVVIGDPTQSDRRAASEREPAGLADFASRVAASERAREPGSLRAVRLSERSVQRHEAVREALSIFGAATRAGARRLEKPRPPTPPPPVPPEAPHQVGHLEQQVLEDEDS